MILPIPPDKVPEHADNYIKLRPARFYDAPFLGEVLRNAEILKKSGADNPIARSTLLLWWWLRRKYPVLYCIEVASSRIGFVGLCNLTGDSGEITLVIFQRKNRRLGYGTKAFSLFVRNLPSYFPSRMVVRVSKENHAALSFWAKLGFSETLVGDDVVVMCTDRKASNLGDVKNG